MAPENQILNALGFRYLSPSEINDDPIFSQLRVHIGSGPRCYVRTDAIGLGSTLARDDTGRLCAVRGQFDLNFFGFKQGPQLRTRLTQRGT